MAVEPGNRTAYTVGLTVFGGNFMQPVALGTAQQAIQDLAADQGRKHGDVFGGVEQTGQAQQGVQHQLIDGLDIQAAAARA